MGEGGPKRDIRPVSMAFARAGARTSAEPWSRKRKLRVPRCGRDSRRGAMSQLDVVDNKTAADKEKASPAYVPPLQRTEGQPPPIAAHRRLPSIAVPPPAPPSTPPPTLAS